jgi:FKBP-type peptidyl-prolyl cis-trans isomerase
MEAAAVGFDTTDSGLRYKILQNGNGKQATKGAMVSVHYKGQLLDGTVFDSSYKRNDTSIFPLNQVIKGWTEGVQYMNKGDIFEFYIPSSLAYGSKGNMSIPANSTLIFQIELINIL